MKSHLLAWTCLAGFVVAGACSAQESNGGAQTAAPSAAATASAPSTANGSTPAAASSPYSIKDFTFGAAIVVNVLNVHNRADQASIVNGIVRVSSNDNTTVGLMGEAHYLVYKGRSENWGVGPFVAAGISTNGGTIASVALGAMVAFKGPGTGSGTNGWSLGVGVSFTPNTQVLGSGFEPDQPPPAGETQVRYETQTATGLLIMVGHTF